jgi:hypothetical protein
MLWHRAGRLRVLAGDVLARRDPFLAGRRATAFLPGAGARRLPSSDPFNSFDHLMRVSECEGLRSTFFFIADQPDVPAGSTFRLSDPWAARLIGEIGRRGHFVALHGSYVSCGDAAQLTREWALLSEACRSIPTQQVRLSVRQHYLRWTPGNTWRAQAEAGLREDETLGFADTIGYRSGTARSYEAYDLVRKKRLGLRVRPLHVMDGALAQVAHDEESADVAALELAARTRRFGGRLSILWHNSQLETRHARDRYARLMAALNR